jgi:glycosyltransferase involved in cell wall biosynthesis
MIGSKGLPAVFGGIERHVEEIGRRLAERGHRVTIFGRKPFSSPGEYLGMEIRILPSIPTKNLDTATNSLGATVQATFGPYDIVHFHGIGPSLFSWIPKLGGKAAVATIHALDYRQQKWGPTARYLLRRGERAAIRFCRRSIAVSQLMAKDLQARYHRSVTYIPNGATLCDPPPFDRAASLGLSQDSYILTVGRFIVERGFHTLLEAFGTIDSDLKLVIVGDARFEEAYARRLRDLADDRVLFPGYISGGLLEELYAHCSFYVLPSTVEGLPISLIEAMSFSRPVLISDIPENLEVAGSLGLTFERENVQSLADGLAAMIGMKEEERRRRGGMARERVADCYTWDMITDNLEMLYREILA